MKTKADKWSAMSAEERDALVMETCGLFTKAADPNAATRENERQWWKDTKLGVIVSQPYETKFEAGSMFFHQWHKFSPSTSIAAAFEVVEKMREKGYAFECATSGASMGDWRAEFENEASVYRANNDSLPEAIALAALRAHGVEVDL